LHPLHPANRRADRDPKLFGGSITRHAGLNVTLRQGPPSGGSLARDSLLIDLQANEQT
jgi:hypothetical protein